MKYAFYYLLIILSVTYFTSCSSDSPEELDVIKETPETITGTDDPEKDPTSKDDPEEAPVDEPKKDPLASCDDFDWTNIIDNKITIDCIVNLNGKTIDIPSNTSVVYEGGDVKNGILNFTSNGNIDGELLNASLDLNGDVQLTSNEFEFIPNRWEIVEGKISDQVAKSNRDNFENTMCKIKEMGGNKFKVNKLDAYFKVDEPSGRPIPSLAAINVPSDFHLSMTSNTHIRMQPNSYNRPTLLATFKANNVTIEGGVLHGDRDEHDYSDGSTHEWGHLLRITGTKNSVFKNIRFEDATGDAIDVIASGHSFDSNYVFSDNVLITNNTMIRSRRNHISITDGRNIIVEKNNFIDASIHTSKSRGVAPGFAIDVEAVRHGHPGGILQIAEDIIIRDNTEDGSRIGAFTVHTGDRVTIENNKLEGSISYSVSIGTIIRNNEITATSDKNINKGTAIVAGRDDLFDKNYDGRVYDNIIKNYAIGISVTNKDIDTYNNQIINCKTGLRINSVRNAKIYNNTIKSTRENSNGIVSHPRSEYMDNVIIGDENKGNIIEVTRAPLLIQNTNHESGQDKFKLTISNNTFKSNSTSTISNVVGLEFFKNSINQGGIRFVNYKNGKINNNIINSTTSNGIRIDKGCENLEISNNKINVMSPFECIKETTTDGINIDVKNLKCN